MSIGNITLLRSQPLIQNTRLTTLPSIMNNSRQKVIIKVIVNLLTKAATAPFSLLGSLFAGGEELSEIGFSPGHSEVTPEAEKRLQALSMEG